MNTTSLLKENRIAGATPSLPEYDVSIILTAHNEARYLKRTFLSIEESVRFARQFDITVEIVVVLDSADQPTTTLAQDYDYTVFDASKVLRVQNGAPGLSRNDGISVARGDYVVTIDGDDLISFDFLQRMYMTSRSLTRKTIIFPEFVTAFGGDYYVYKLYNKRYIGNAAFFDGHPYVACAMFPREFLARVRNAHASLRNGYAHEDWHFNCECLAAGYDIAVAAGAILFYRQRSGSMRRRFVTETGGLIPKSRFFEPSTYLKLTWSEFVGENRRPVAPPFLLQDFLSLPGIADVVAAANGIEPAISLGILKYKPAGSNLRELGPAAHAYFRACKIVAANAFTDVLLVPFMAKGGAEKYILSVLNEIHRQQADAKLLVISTHLFNRHDWIDRLPLGSVFLDLHGLGVDGLTTPMIETITFRLLQNIGSIKRLHMKNCEFVDAFARNYLKYLPALDSTFYHFCDPRVEVEGVHFINGQSFDLVAESGMHLTRAVSDHATNLALLDQLVGCAHLPKLETIYNLCSLPESAADPGRGPSGRLLWAARIDEQKRPHLARAIAARLKEEKLDVRIEAFGGTTYGLIGPDVFEGEPLLAYRGDYDGFMSLPAAEFDAFLYTAGFDGLPNVVLEALAAGLPVIAADVGGIGEAVTPETGYLVDDNAGEEALVDRYVETIKAIYQNWPDAVRRGQNGRNLVAERHSETAYRARIAKVFFPK